MSWFISTSDMPGRPYAVHNGKGEIAGCHQNRQMAYLQMTALNENGSEMAPEPEVEPKRAVTKDEKPKQKPLEPIVAFSRSQTQAW